MNRFFKICMHIAILSLLLNGMEWIGITDNFILGIPQAIITFPYIFYIFGLVGGIKVISTPEDKDKDEV